MLYTPGTGLRVWDTKSGRLIHEYGMMTTALLWKESTQELFGSAPFGRAKYPETGQSPSHLTWVSKTSTVASESIPGETNPVISVSIGTVANRASCSDQKAA